MRIVDLKICEDCAAIIANDQFPPDWDEERCAEHVCHMDFRWPVTQWVLANGNSEGDDEGNEFSWSACGACGSVQGGARHPAHAIAR